MDTVRPVARILAQDIEDDLLVRGILDHHRVIDPNLEHGTLSCPSSSGGMDVLFGHYKLRRFSLPVPSGLHQVVHVTRRVAARRTPVPLSPTMQDQAPGFCQASRACWPPEPSPTASSVTPFLLNPCS